MADETTKSGSAPTSATAMTKPTSEPSSLVDSEAVARLCDDQWIAGAKVGYNFGAAQSHKGFKDCIDNRIAQRPRKPTAGAEQDADTLEQEAADWWADHISEFVEPNDETGSFNYHFDRALAAFSFSQNASLQAEVEKLKQDNHDMLWNLGGCEAIASGWSKPEGYSKELARPALDAVARLAKRAETAESALAEARGEIGKRDVLLRNLLANFDSEPVASEASYAVLDELFDEVRQLTGGGIE